jgi:hypothetical protein
MSEISGWAAAGARAMALKLNCFYLIARDELCGVSASDRRVGRGHACLFAGDSVTETGGGVGRAEPAPAARPVHARSYASPIA